MYETHVQPFLTGSSGGISCIVLFVRTAALVFLFTMSASAGDAFGTWIVNPARSTSAPDPRPRRLTIRIESHAKGEVFTVDRIEADGRTTTSSTLLFLDGKPRDFQDAGCSGTQSSWRVDSRTVEILRTCLNGDRIRLVRRSSTEPPELVLDVTGHQAGGRSFERHLVLERQSVPMGPTPKNRKEKQDR